MSTIAPKSLEQLLREAELMMDLARDMLLCGTAREVEQVLAASKAHVFTLTAAADSQCRSYGGFASADALGFRDDAVSHQQMQQTQQQQIQPSEQPLPSQPSMTMLMTIPPCLQHRDDRITPPATLPSVAAQSRVRVVRRETAARVPGSEAIAPRPWTELEKCRFREAIERVGEGESGAIGAHAMAE